jgi:hypothetical protein
MKGSVLRLFSVLLDITLFATEGSELCAHFGNAANKVISIPNPLPRLNRAQLVDGRMYIKTLVGWWLIDG